MITTVPSCSRQATGFRRSGQPSEASVVLKLRGGSEPTEGMVQGISHLVASSVDGVEADEDDGRRPDGDENLQRVGTTLVEFRKVAANQ